MMRFAAMKPTPKGLWRRVPPVVFLPLLGLLGLGLGWRVAGDVWGFEPAPVEIYMGGVVLLSLFTLCAGTVKTLRRPASLIEDMRVLPSRAGLFAAAFCLCLLAVVLAPYVGQGAARVILYAGLAVQILLFVLFVVYLLRAPKGTRLVDPVLQLVLAGWAVPALAAQQIGMGLLALVLFWVALVPAVAVWVLSVGQFARESVGASLRPLLGLHLVPVAVLGMVSAGFIAGALTAVLAVLSALGVAVLLMRVRWVLASGITPMWGALTFPVAMTAGFWILLGGYWQIAGGCLLVLATLFVIPVAIRIYKMWASGQLAVKTNAAIA